MQETSSKILANQKKEETQNLKLDLKDFKQPLLSKELEVVVCQRHELNQDGKRIIQQTIRSTLFRFSKILLTSCCSWLTP